MSQSTDDPRPAPSRKVFIKTFGCQMNEYDSDKMVDVLHAAAGYEQTADVEQADLILFNTCSVREKAQEKVFSDLGRVKHLKDKGVLIGVGGCVASQEGAAIVARAPYVDMVFGPQTLHRLPQMIERRRSRAAPAGRHQFSGDREVRPPAAGPRAGCERLRLDHGRLLEVLQLLRRALHPRRGGLAPVRRRAGRGGRAGRSGRARGHAARPERQRLPRRDGRSTGEIADFALLLDYVAAMPGIERIRYTTSHPNEFGQRLIDAYARLPKLVNHVHLPVQHGSDRILMAMKRGYTAMEYKSTLRKLRLVRPDIRISSDFIVGFPGETDADFARTMQLIDEIGFDSSFSFVFSARPGTPAAALPDDDAAGAQAAAAADAAGGDRGNARRISDGRWSARCSASWSRGRRASSTATSPN